MKKICLLTALLLGSVATTLAQDLIVKRDSSRMESKVLEIDDTQVRYKRFSNPDGPTYTTPLTQVAYIRYANGETERFGKAAPASDYVLRTYGVGDYYENDDLRGIVIMVDEAGLHGTLLSIDEIVLPWSTFRKPDFRQVGATNREDGMENMKAVEQYIAENGLTWGDFPAFQWCREMGEGWYLPSIDECLYIGHNFNGGSRAHNNRPARTRFNNTLKSHEGKRLDMKMYYYSSTELDGKSAMASQHGLEPPYVVDLPKTGGWRVRAIHKF